MSLDSVCVNEEVEIELDVNEAYEGYPYTGHEIKSDPLRLGPDLPGPSILLPDVQEESTHITVKKEYDVKLHSSCSVRLERLPISKLRNKMELTNAERQKRYRDQLQVQNPEKNELIKKRKNLQECLKRKQCTASSLVDEDYLRFKANYRIKEQLHTNRNDNNSFIEAFLPNNSEQEKEMPNRRKLELPNTCEYCQRTCKSHYFMKKHQNIHVKQLLYTNDDKVAAKFGYMTKSEPEIPYTCDVCSDSFIDEAHLKKHMQIHELELGTLTKQSEEDIQKRYPERDDITFAKEAMDTRYYCVTCAKVFKVSFFLFAKHLLNHIDENPLLKQILKEFVSSNPIERSCRGQNYTFICHICKCAFGKEGAFRKHMMYEYLDVTNEDTYCCKPANETNDSFPPVIPTKQTSILATALTSNKTQHEIYKETTATNSKSINESIDFQKSSLFSRLKLLNKVVGK